MDNIYQTKNICRICLVENNEEIQSVFDTIDKGEPVQFSEMLMAFAKIEILSGDELPGQICSNCAQNTIKFYSFKIKCEESDEILRNRLKKDHVIVIDKIEVDEEDILEDNLKSEIIDENVEAADVLNDSSGLMENSNLETIVYEDYDACASPKCIESLNSLNNSITDSTLSISEESFECDATRERDLLHRNKVAEIAHKIKMIEQQLDSGRIINEDKNTRNDKASYLVIFMKDQSNLKNSMGSHKGQKSFFTSDKSSDDLRNLRKHTVKQVFTKSSSLAKHKLIDSTKYGCNYCKMKFSRAASLLTHVRMKHPYAGKTGNKNTRSSFIFIP